MSTLEVGEKFYAKATETNRRCGIRAGDVGFVTCMVGNEISFYLQRRSAGGYIEATCAKSVFAMNFATDWRLAGLQAGDLADGGGGPWVNRSYASARLYVKRFPEDVRV